MNLDPVNLENEELEELLFDKKHGLPCQPINRAMFCVSDLAQWLAGASDKEQATFFNEFDVKLRSICRLQKGSMGHAMQIAMAAKYLTDDAKFTLADLGSVH